MSMGRQPTVNLNLPKGMRAKVMRSGRTYYYFDTGGKPRKDIALGPDYVLAVQKWAELSQHTIPANATITFKMAWDKFLQDYLPSKSAATQKDYLKCSKHLLAFFASHAHAMRQALLDEIQSQPTQVQAQ